MEFLRDSDEGLVYEMVAGSKFRSIKGGKMSKLIEMMTSVLNQGFYYNDSCLLILKSRFIIERMHDHVTSLILYIY